jgi:S-DNA-T family DNA segregation ATPase FtsK/SpoIIIE
MPSVFWPSDLRSHVIHVKVGYGRAARIVDQLYAAGLLRPPDGSKRRDVLIGLEDLDRICG